MPDMATIQRILERQGAPPTPDNVNRIIQAMASDPSILERYSLGTAPAQMQQGPTGMRDIRGGAGMNDNSALLTLNRPTTNGPPQGDNVPAGNVTVGQPTRVAPPGPPRPREVTGPDAPLRTGAGSTAMAEPPLPNAPRMTESQTGSGQGTGGTQIPGMEPAPPPPEGDNVGWLTLLLPSIINALRGGGSTPTPTVPQLPGPLPPSRQLPAPAPQITGPQATGRGAGAGGVNQPNTTRALPAPPEQKALSAPPKQLTGPPGHGDKEKQRLQGEVDAENAALEETSRMERQRMQEAMRKRKAQDQTRETLRRAKGAVTGGRPR